MNLPVTRAVQPPRPKCAAASNGWIVAVVECGPPPDAAAASPFSSNASSAAPPSRHALTALVPPLRLVSRWNVRRGTPDLVPLPPPVRPGTAAEVGGASASAGSDPNFGRVAHAFVDPTGCHVLLSARNGEAYCLHSTSGKARKLNGFGPGPDGSYSGYEEGVSLGDAALWKDGGDEAAEVQTGLTPGSYVTAVGWDR